MEQAVRTSLSGRPGPVYLDFPDDVIRTEVDEDKVEPAARVETPVRPRAGEADVERALDLLESAENPLVIVGKGMAWSRAEDAVRAFLKRTRLPFLATPMGKGVASDDDPLSVGAARSTALREADVVLLMGARLNWILHFGLPPRFRKDVRIIQLDIAAEEIGHNVPAEVALVGDGRAVVEQLNDGLSRRDWTYPDETAWRTTLHDKAASNAETIRPMIEDESSPMNYYRAYRDIVAWLPDDAIVIGEGANAMDIGRTQMPNRLARHRLDAGTYGTMGIGLGFAIAAALVHPDKAIVSVQGDSAFGFSGMEVETMVRYHLPVKMVVLNNGGIGGGVGRLGPDDRVPPGVLGYGARYEGMVEALGGRGSTWKIRPTCERHWTRQWRSTDRRWSTCYWIRKQGGSRSSSGG